MSLSRHFPMLPRLGFVLLALCLPAGASTAHAQQSTFIGTWVNNTFGSTGSASFSGGIQGDQLVFTFDLNGNVFGQSRSRESGARSRESGARRLLNEQAVAGDLATRKGSQISPYDLSQPGGSEQSSGSECKLDLPLESAYPAHRAVSPDSLS